MKSTRRLQIPTLALAGLIAALAPAALATSWWLPTNYSEHGKDVDHLFNYIFWLTSAVMVGVFIFMAYFLVKYRFRADRKKAHYSHGNIRLEIAWTIIPAFFLAVIVIWTKGSWDTFRYGVQNDPRKPAKMLVIAQQFAWNVIYAGPDGKIGKYLVYPKPSDRRWPAKLDAEGKLVYEVFEYNGVETKGPADLSFDDAVAAIGQYIDANNPLGKDFTDPDGVDDIIPTPGEINVPLDRPLHIELVSKDVLHSFFLPNYRVKLDAVPGLRGVIRFTATGVTSKQREEDPANRTTVETEKLVEVIRKPEYAEIQIVADATTPGAVEDPATKTWGFKDKAGQPLVAHGKIINFETVAKLREAGVKQITYRRSGAFDLVCEELCGGQHGDMRGTMIVLTQAEFAQRFETKKTEAAEASVNPSVATTK